MSELQAANKHSPFIPVFFLLGRSTHLPNSVKCEGQLWAWLPHSPSSGEACWVKQAEWSLLLKCEGRLPKGWRDQSAPRTQAWKPEEKGIWTVDPKEKREGFCVYSACPWQSETQRWTEQAGGQSCNTGSPREVTPPPLLVERGSPAVLGSFAQPRDDLGVWL